VGVVHGEGDDRPLPRRGADDAQRIERAEPPDLAGKLADHADRKRIPQALVVETALASHLSPDGSDRLEAALARRLDRMTRQIERLERHVTISNEALALFVRFWLTSTPPFPIPPKRRRRRRAGSATTASSKPWVDDWREGGRSPMRSAATFILQRRKAMQRPHNACIEFQSGP
jgi:hypothetical protein